jgi:hypothetical protein
MRVVVSAGPFQQCDRASGSVARQQGSFTCAVVERPGHAAAHLASARRLATRPATGPGRVDSLVRHLTTCADGPFAPGRAAIHGLHWLHHHPHSAGNTSVAGCRSPGSERYRCSCSRHKARVQVRRFSRGRMVTFRSIRAARAHGAWGRTSHNPPTVGSSPTRPTRVNLYKNSICRADKGRLRRASALDNVRDRRITYCPGPFNRVLGRGPAGMPHL